MIGLSLSFCVRDIAEGNVCEGNVTKILCGTRARTPEQWEIIFEQYRQVYWRKQPEESEAIARRLLESGKLEQPRLTMHKCANLGNSIVWVENESQIVWSEGI